MLHYIQRSPFYKDSGESAKTSLHYDGTRAIKRELIHFQIVLWSDHDRPIKVRIKDCSDTRSDIYLMKSVPVSFPHYSFDSNSDYILDDAGSVADCLLPLSPIDTIMIGKNPTILWVTAKALFEGDFTVSYEFSADDECVRTKFNIKGLDLLLKEGICSLSAAISSHSIASSENVPMFCNVYWDDLFKHFELAEKQGIDEIITPLFASFESDYFQRDADQLIRVKVVKRNYEFCFDTLDSWILGAKRKNIKRFLFTAIFPSMVSRKCPRVYAEGYSERYLIFSEEDDILSDEFMNFLRIMLRKLVAHLKELGLSSDVSFTMTDEVSAESMDVYNECFERIRRALSGHKIYHYFDDPNLLQFLNPSTAIVSIDAAKYFADPMIASRCTFDPDGVHPFLSPLIAASAMRIKSFGPFCYAHQINSLVLRYYNCAISPQSRKYFDPLIAPDGDGAFPAGSLFWIYNHSSGPLISIRLALLRSALQDATILKMAEAFIGRDKILNLIETSFPATFEQDSLSEKKFELFRDQVYDLLEKGIEDAKCSE